MIGSGNLTKKAYIATTLKPKNKQRIKKVTKVAGVGLLVGVLPYLAYKGVHYLYAKGRNSQNGKTITNNGIKTSFKTQYGLKSRTHLDKANRIIKEYYRKLKKNREKGSYETQLAVARKNIANPDSKISAKAQLTIDYINTKLAHADYRAQKIINYIIKRGKEQQLQTDQHDISATDRLKKYIDRVTSKNSS